MTDTILEQHYAMSTSYKPPDLIGFVGLGNMGSPMAGLLAGAGFKLAVADAMVTACARFAEQFACERPATLRRLGETCRVVITMLPDGEVVRDVLMQKDGVVEGLQAGAVVIDMSSSSPVGTRSLATELAARNIHLVDAPVSGGVRRAEQGTLAIMAGGDAEIIESVRPVLEAMGTVYKTGVQGSGHAMKALNNYLPASTASAVKVRVPADR